MRKIISIRFWNELDGKHIRGRVNYGLTKAAQQVFTNKPQAVKSQLEPVTWDDVKAIGPSSSSSRGGRVPMPDAIFVCAYASSHKVPLFSLIQNQQHRPFLVKGLPWALQCCMRWWWARLYNGTMYDCQFHMHFKLMGCESSPQPTINLLSIHFWKLEEQWIEF